MAKLKSYTPTTAEITLEARLSAVTEEYANADSAEKRAKKAKEELREQFLALATQWIEETRPLAHETVLIPYEDLGNRLVKELIAREYPKYRILNQEFDQERQQWVVDIEEDPELVEFTWPNHEVRLVFGRTSAMVGSSFDTEAFYKEHESIALLAGVNVKQVTQYEFDEDQASDLVREKPEYLPVMQKYAHPGKPQVRMTPIRPMKEEDE